MSNCGGRVIDVFDIAVKSSLLSAPDSVLPCSLLH